MLPKLFSYDSFVLPTYGVLVAIGFIAGLLVAVRLAGEAGLEKERIFNLGVAVSLGGILGGKVFLIVQDWEYYRQQPGNIFSFSVLQSGGIFYGGLLFAIAVGFWYIRRSGLPFLRVADAFAPGIALGHGIGRLGCFAAGCCWGKPTEMFWGVTFTNPYSHEVVGVPLGIALHPTQLYESAAELLIFAFLYFQYRRKRFDGQTLGGFLLLYPAARFLIEFARDHAVNAWLWDRALSDAQGLSLLLMAVGVWLLWLGPQRHSLLSPASVSHEHTPSSGRRKAKPARG